MSVYCGDPDCEECQYTRAVPKREKTMNIEVILIPNYNPTISKHPILDMFYTGYYIISIELTS